MLLRRSVKSAQDLHLIVFWVVKCIIHLQVKALSHKDWDIWCVCKVCRRSSLGALSSSSDKEYAELLDELISAVKQHRGDKVFILAAFSWTCVGYMPATCGLILEY